jgi:hypothetical protein
MAPIPNNQRLVPALVQISTKVVQLPGKVPRVLTQPSTLSATSIAPISITASASLWFSHNWGWFVGLFILAIASTFIFVFRYHRSLLQIKELIRENRKGSGVERDWRILRRGNQLLFILLRAESCMSHRGVSGRRWWTGGRL